MDDLEVRLQEISTAPRITAEDVEKNIKTCYFTTAYQAASSSETQKATQSRHDPYGAPIDEALQVVTLAIVTTHSGFTVIGMSGCADPKNFNKEIGQEIAKRNAVSQLWGHMGYMLQQQLYQVRKIDEINARVLSQQIADGSYKPDVYTEDDHHGLDHPI